jgi:uncharacterized SAM-binding protein YcdF (DUF218 family)
VHLAILNSAVLNIVTTTTLLFTVISALLLGIYSAYWTVRGILYAFVRRPAASTRVPAKVVPFPASMSVNART